MASIFDIFASQLNDDQLGNIAKQIGADKGKTQDAISMTLPALIEALGRQTSENSAPQSTTQGGFGDILPPSTPVGQTKLPAPAPTQAPAASQRPSTSPLDDILGKILGGGSQASKPSGSGGDLSDIFSELLGSKQSKVSDAVSKSSGLSKEQTGSLISILGPILSGAIGSHAQKNNLGVEDLSNMIQNDRAKIQKSPGGGIFGKMLDQDGDGDFDMNDMLKLGMGMMFKMK
jgi:hypothetical protein